jgi:hypothetical protein
VGVPAAQDRHGFGAVPGRILPGSARAITKAIQVVFEGTVVFSKQGLKADA